MWILRRARHRTGTVQAPYRHRTGTTRHSYRAARHATPGDSKDSYLGGGAKAPKQKDGGAPSGGGLHSQSGISPLPDTGRLGTAGAPTHASVTVSERNAKKTPGADGSGERQPSLRQTAAAPRQRLRACQKAGNGRHTLTSRSAGAKTRIRCAEAPHAAPLLFAGAVQRKIITGGCFRLHQNRASRPLPAFKTVIILHSGPYELTCPLLSGVNLNPLRCFCACADVVGELVLQPKPSRPIRGASCG